jgi:hypothetical protein
LHILLKISNIKLSNQSKITMLQRKDTTNISELNDFFTSSEKVCETILWIIRSLKLNCKRFELSGSDRTIYGRGSVLTYLLLFPLFQLPNVRAFSQSILVKLFGGGKDVFYRLKNNEMIPWRSLHYRVTLQLIGLAKSRSSEETTGLKCLIADDTDLPKTGRCIELIGRIWSHVSNGSILGFKGLFLGYHDGKSFFGLDFSLHGEKGKNEKKPYGLTPKQLKDRSSKRRSNLADGAKRKSEYFQKKTDNLLSMIRTAISKGIRFDYLLVDSWFVCDELISFVLGRKIKCHLLGMAKMGRTRYDFNGQSYTAKELVEKMKRNKKTKRSRLLNVWYSIADVYYKGNYVRLFFCKTTHRGNWNVLLTTNTDLEFEEAYRIYSIRWAVEIFFKEAKNYLRLGKSQSQDFDAQIADTTICLMQYNILSLAKRLLDYESMGELFKKAGTETLELTVVEKIWGYLLELIALIADIFEIDMEEILNKIADGNQSITKIIKMKAALNAA